MLEVPHPRELTDGLKSQPFALLGINCDRDKQAAVKAMESQRITWPNWHDGAPGVGPIVQRYQIGCYPTALVLDARGIIRDKEARGSRLDHRRHGFVTRPTTRRAVQALIKRYVTGLWLDADVSVHFLRVTALTTARERGSDLIDLKASPDPRTRGLRSPPSATATG
jgi:hypothetical protein